MSFENLDNTRPTGVVSKNINGARKIDHNMTAWRKTAAFNVPRRGERSQAIDAIALKKGLKIER